MGYAVKMGKLGDERPTLTYFTFLNGNGTKPSKSEYIPYPVVQKPTNPVTPKVRVPFSGFYTLPFDSCIGGWLKFRENNNNGYFTFGTQPKSRNKIYIDPRGRRWPNAFQSKLICGERVDQNENTPAELDYKWGYYEGSVKNNDNQSLHYEIYMEYVNYFSICNTLASSNLPIWDGYLFGFRNREYFKIDYEYDEDHRMTVTASTEGTGGYRLILSIPCIISSNVCDDKTIRITDNQHGRTGNASAQARVRSEQNYVIISRDGKEYRDNFHEYREYTDFNVPVGGHTSVRGPKVDGKYVADATHYGDLTHKWQPTGEEKSDYATSHRYYNNYVCLNDHVAKTELNFGFKVFDTSGRELTPRSGESIYLNLDITIYKQNLNSGAISDPNRNPNASPWSYDPYINYTSGKRIGATIHIDREFVVL